MSKDEEQLEQRSLLTEARDFIRGEYQDLLMSVCPWRGGAPVRGQVDPASRLLVEQYEALLAKLDEALK